MEDIYEKRRESARHLYETIVGEPSCILRFIAEQYKEEPDLEGGLEDE